MRQVIYYSLMLLLGFFWYRYGQKLLRQGPRDENDELAKGPLGPVGLLMSAGIACTLFFFMMRGLIRREIPCVGKGCQSQLYTLAANAADYWANMFFLLWMVLGLGYAVYVTLRIWYRS
ncbi:hypothetical protein A3K87_13775 [Variovorax paradoxus]|uniref:Uncharacterized protein n=1 Tax=Variovorax paradoxus TaxID=34073 RepID=A0AA91DQV4_VARPD|nr:hypothetical protein [Variovorax paradoxus]OAK64465.1 hypothetical protein A3K87_13775 [Variovorax paradoxus]